MVIKKGKSIFRAALDDDLIIEVKIAALRAKVNPNKIVEIALRNYLNAPDRLESHLKKGS